MNCNTRFDDSHSTQTESAAHAGHIAVLQRLHSTLSLAADGHAEEIDAIAAALSGLAELDSADRIAGQAVRRMQGQAEQINRFNLWLANAKTEAGFDPSTSFDIVWSQTLTQAREAAAHCHHDEPLIEFDQLPRIDAMPVSMSPVEAEEPVQAVVMHAVQVQVPATAAQRRSGGAVLLSNPSAHNQF